MPFRSPDPAAPGTVHVLDDDADLGAAVARMLTRQGFVATAFDDPAALLAAYPGRAAHAVVTDVMMGEWNGFDFAERLRSLDAHVAILFMTAWPSTAHAVDSVRLHGGVDYLDKPIDEARLCASLREGVAWSTASRATARRLGDLSPRERQVFDLATVTRLQQMKTGALICAAVEAGAILGRVPPEGRTHLRGYAHDLGLAFQIADDLLDAEGDEAAAGKKLRKDQDAGKATFLSLLGVERAREQCRMLVVQAIEHLRDYGPEADLLRAIASYVVERDR